MKKGDKVSYMSVKKSGRGFSISSKEGVFEEYTEKGNIKVKTRNGILKICSKGDVTPIGKRNALTKALVGDE